MEGVHVVGGRAREPGDGGVRGKAPVGGSGGLRPQKLEKMSN